MKTRKLLKHRTIRIRFLAILSAIAIAGAATSRAGLVGPYPVDGSTLHMWHFDETSGTLAYDAMSNQLNGLAGWQGTFTMTNVAGNPAFPTAANGGLLATEFASNAQPSYVAYTNGVPYVSYNSCILTTNESAYMQAGFSESSSGSDPGFGTNPEGISTLLFTNIANYCNTNTGAFTMEALVNCDENLQNLPNGQQDILCADSGNGNRGFIFGIYPITGGGADLDFFIIGSSLGNIQYGTILAPLPTNGPDAAIQGQWYHAAVTYTGQNPTNGDTPNILTVYWTLMDPARTNCDVLWQTNVSLNDSSATTHNLLGGETPFLDIGCSARENIDTANLSWAGWDGNIDEVRISNVRRGPDQMVFNYTNIPEAPTVAGLPASESLASSVNLELIPVVFGSLPFTTYQWYQIVNGVTNLLAGQTSSTLLVPGVTALNNGGYFLAVTNAYGGTNSAVVQVTVGLQSFDGLYNTGVNSNGAPLTTVGGYDPHWFLPVDPDPNGIIPYAVAWTITPSGSGYNPATATSDWIGPENGGGNLSTEQGVYVYTTSFIIDQGSPTNATLSGDLLTGGTELGSQIQCIINNVTNIINNGVYAGGVQTDPFSFSGTNDGFQLGSNTLTFVLTNNNSQSLGECGIQVYALAGSSTALTNAPYITNQPANVTVNYGQDVGFSVVAIGAPNLTYHWKTNGAPNTTSGAVITNGYYTGITNRFLNFLANNITPAQVHNGVYTNNYYVIVTNSEGSVTSALAELTVLLQPTLSQLPVNYTNLFTLYAGVNPTFSVQPGGVPGPFTYGWYTNSVWDKADTASNLLMTNVQIGFFTNYCIVSNIYTGPVTSTVWTAQVIADPLNSSSGPAPYPQTVLSLNPVGYWRLNDTNLDGIDNGNGDSGYICDDYAGGNDGIYTNVYLNLPGYNPTTDPSDSSAQFGDDADFGDDTGNQDANFIEGINFGTPFGTSGAFTVEAWVEGNSQDNGGTGAGIVALGYGGGGEQFCLDCGAPTNAYRFFYRDGSSTAHVANSVVLPTTTASQGPWYYLVGVVDEINSQEVTFYIDGVPAGTASAPTGDGILAPTEPMSIGARSASVGSSLENQFTGNINDVAVFNYALSPSQVANEYDAGGGTIAPYFNPTPPTSATSVATSTLAIPATAYGTPPLGYWWTNMTTGASIISGTTNNASGNVTLNYANVPFSWNSDQLQLTVSNAYGSTNSLFTVTILPLTNIVATVTNKVLYLSWPASYINNGWQLQAQTNKVTKGISTNWVNVSGSTAVDATNFPIVSTNGTVFYRLIYTP